ncbi:hypothetical protein GCM10010353_71100 [Streptomyces chryseus]|nr:hypothetical protein GCM10010353_71100 [Streptomyces chryseus]
MIELGGHGGKVLGAVNREVRALGKVLPQRAVDVLVGTALKGAGRIVEVDRDVGGTLNSW